mmetsp:Transcript_13586/g.42027  ORF Transcript_13586/g.42027 Transcript_13586/m.42027 type:complete len:305 (-) Transcript_13586:9-923(-)
MKSLVLAASLATALQITHKRVTLPSGQRLEWLTCIPAARPFAPPPKDVVCVHGTFHGAWCWEPWLERFASEHGVKAHALSLRGTSASPCEEKAVKLSTHARDLTEAIEAELGANARPALVAHSFGGPVALDAVATGLDVEAVALLCSVPPSGNKPGTARVLRRSLGDAWLITRAFALKTAGSRPADGNAVFFNGLLDDATAEAYAARFFADSRKGLDLSDYQRSLPRWPVDAAGAWAAKPAGLRSLVVGCAADFVVDAEAVAETAAFMDAEPVVIPDCPHDLMLAPGFAEGACDLVGSWVTSAA